MGSPLSPIIADLVLQDIENKALFKIGKKIKFYYRYVDDILIAVDRDSLQNIVDIFNSFHDRLRFTIEPEHNRNINFLDLKIYINSNNRLILDWFHKDTYSGRYLSFFSNHPICHKIGTIYGLIDKSILLSHPSFHQKNIKFSINILLNNGYPLPFIFKYVSVRIKKLLFTKLKHLNMDNSSINCESKEKKYIAVPYIKGLSESVCKVFNNSEFSTGFKCFNRLNRFIRVHKDTTPKLKENNVVYKINCKDCDASYVGQTKRHLETRVKEHMNNIKQPFKPSVITEHITNENHSIQWDNIKILDHEPHYFKRLISEMIFIKKQRNGLNKIEDLSALNNMYFPLLDSL